MLSRAMTLRQLLELPSSPCRMTVSGSSSPGTVSLRRGGVSDASATACPRAPVLTSLRPPDPHTRRRTSLPRPNASLACHGIPCSSLGWREFGEKKRKELEADPRCSRGRSRGGLRGDRGGMCRCQTSLTHLFHRIRPRGAGTTANRVPLGATELVRRGCAACSVASARPARAGVLPPYPRPRCADLEILVRDLLAECRGLLLLSGHCGTSATRAWSSCFPS